MGHPPGAGSSATEVIFLFFTQYDRISNRREHALAEPLSLTGGLYRPNASAIMEVLDARQSKGGDRRGMQSAGILIVMPIPPGSRSTTEHIVDVRVDDAVTPFRELRRALNVGLSSDHMMHSADLLQQGKLAEAIVEDERACTMNPRSEQIRCALARTTPRRGRTLRRWRTGRCHRNAEKSQASGRRNPAFAKWKE
jgi:hypothetical protein